MSACPHRNCPVCGSGDSLSRGIIGDHLGLEDFLLHECRTCGLWYVKDPPPPARLAGYYGNAGGDAMRKRPSGFFLALQRLRLARDVALIQPPLKPGMRVLDVGAGDGAMSAFLARRGFRVKAIDSYPAQEWPWPGIPFETVDLNADSFDASCLRFPDGKTADVAILRHVLEHLRSPLQVLKAMKTAGVARVLVAVPNVDSRLRHVFGANWAYWDPPRHLSCFSFATLAMLAYGAGYIPTAQTTYGIDEVFFSLFRALLLRRRHRAPDAMMPWWIRLLGPKGPFAAVSSVVSSVFGNTICLCLLESGDAASTPLTGGRRET